MKIDVLDKGSVELLDHMGDDLAVVDAARVSFAKESGYLNSDKELHEYTTSLVKRKSGKWNLSHDDRIRMWIDDIVYPCLNYEDVGLISYLTRHNHWTPFSHCHLKFRVKAPIFVRTQLFKHKVGLTENEVSRRYVDTPPEMYDPYEWRSRPDKSIKQGSGDTIQWFQYNPGGYLEVYKRAIEEGIAPEQARMLLPQSTYTEWIWSGSLSAFARVYKQRTHDTAQWETRQYAKAIGELVEPLFPVSWKALTGE